MRSRPLALLPAVLVLLGGTAVLPASAEIADPSAGQLAASLANGSNVITGAEYVEGLRQGPLSWWALSQLPVFPGRAKALPC